MNATTSNSTELHRELQGFCGSPVQLALGLSLLLAIASPVLRAQAPAAQAPQAQTAQAVQTLAFPGAEGYGATATGGRGKQVIAVTTLADDGPGSFRAAVTHSGATVVFNVNGVIHLKSNVTLASDLTIAGQSAPGDGVTVADAKVTMTGSHNVIIRYMRFRGGIAESQGSSSLQLGNASHVMLDHLLHQLLANFSVVVLVPAAQFIEYV